MKIGIAYTTHNRNEVAATSIIHAVKHSPGIHLVVVDDGSKVPYIGADFRFETPVGISGAKNKCLELLYDVGCTDLFLFDDDTYPLNNGWWIPYLNSGLLHAAYTFDRKILNTTPIYTEYEKPCGCLLYFSRMCLETVGGWDTDFVGYGYEHVNLSDRIFNADLTPARYIDVIGSKFGMSNAPSSILGSIRAATIPGNFKLYQEKFNSKEFKPFK